MITFQIYEHKERFHYREKGGKPEGINYPTKIAARNDIIKGRKKGTYKIEYIKLNWWQRIFNKLKK